MGQVVIGLFVGLTRLPSMNEMTLSSLVVTNQF